MAILKLIYLDNKYTIVPDTLTIDISQWYYGDILEIPLLIWDRYATGNKAVGAIFVGDSGSGKTDVTSILAYIANEKGMDVVNISSIKVTEEILPIIDNILELGVVLILDEYEKTFPANIQPKLLTLLSKKRERKSLILYTANNINFINEYMRNRPGRVHYLFEFNKLSWNTVTEYCEKHNVSAEFINDLKLVWQRADRFSMDHLSGIVEEHLFTPHKSLSAIINIVNVPSLRKEVVYEITVTYDELSAGTNNTAVSPDNTWDGDPSVMGFATTQVAVKQDDKIVDNTITVTNNKIIPAEHLKFGYMRVSIYANKYRQTYNLNLNRSTLVVDEMDSDGVYSNDVKRYRDQGFLITATKKLVEKTS